ncbi:MAG TPA: DUF1015 domain-containing protein [Pirellulales bacterium]|nr:DUF1015 domain-containing protein [Pirellulales bacterium]
MPTIAPFRALRYDLKQVDSLSNVICPPYDVIDSDLQNKLYKLHPANVVRMELNRDEPGDGDINNPDANQRYSRAAKFLKNWRSEGVLYEEPKPAVYVYHQSFEYAGKKHTRRGFMVRCRLERFGEGEIYPHEETLSGPKADRLLLTRACRANLSQIFGLYPDAENAAQELLEQAVAEQTPVEATDHLGLVHRMWTVTDEAVIKRLTDLMEPKPMFIADGHHRYETACNYRDELETAGKLTPDHPANYVLMMCVGMNDSGLLVLPTHRLFRGLAAMDSKQLADKLGPHFTTRVAGEGADLAPTVWDEIEAAEQQGTLGFFTGQDERWTVAKVTEAGRKRMAEIAAEHSADWQGLGVSLLHRLVVDTLLAAKDLPKPKYVHTVDEVVQSLEQGDAATRDATGVMGQGGRFEFAALVMPATVEHIRQISQHGERMPAKSTYFYPKLVSGLVINPLE